MSKTVGYAIAFGFAALAAYVVVGNVVYLVVGNATESRNVSISVGLIAAIYFAAGLLFGRLWQTPGWVWGLLIAAPFLTVLLFSMAFTGIFTRFWDADVPRAIAAIVAPCIGVFVGRTALRH